MLGNRVSKVGELAVRCKRFRYKTLTKKSEVPRAFRSCNDWITSEWLKHSMCVESVYECYLVQTLGTSRNVDNSVEVKGTNKRQMPVFQRSSSMISVFKVSSDLKVIYQLSWYNWLISKVCDSILNSHSKPEVQRHAIWFWLWSLLAKSLFWSFIGTSFHVIFYPCAPFGSVGSHHILQFP